MSNELLLIMSSNDTTIELSVQDKNLFKLVRLIRLIQEKIEQRKTSTYCIVRYNYKPRF